MTEGGWPRVADTSFLYAIYDRTDEHHAEALAALARRGPIVLPGEVATEFIGLAAARLGRAASKQAFADLVQRPNVEMVHETDARAAVALIGEAGSFVDAVVLWHCRRLGIPAETFDGRLAALAKPS